MDDITAPDPTADNHESSSREKMLEHVFVSELLQEAWFRYGRTLEVLRSEVDSAGYDLVLEFNGVIRHVQLKSSRRGRRPQFSLSTLPLPRNPVVAWCGCSTAGCLASIGRSCAIGSSVASWRRIISDSMRTSRCRSMLNGVPRNRFKGLTPAKASLQATPNCRTGTWITCWTSTCAPRPCGH